MSAITLTPDTPEPQEAGVYLICRPAVPTFPIQRVRTEDGSCTWEIMGSEGVYAWREVIQCFAGPSSTIQSLADHDREVRSKALELTDEEQVDRAIKALVRSLFYDDELDISHTTSNPDSLVNDNFKKAVRKAFGAALDE